MAERQLIVKILGDSKDLERAFRRSSQASGKLEADLKRTSRTTSAALANEFRSQTNAVRGITAAERELIKVRSRRASSVGPFRVAGVGLAAGLGLFSATQAVRELSKGLEATGKEAFTTGGKLRNMVAALTGGNLIGAVEALRATPKTLEDIGFSAARARAHLGALQIVAFGAGNAFRQENFPTKEQKRALDALHEAQKKTGVSSQNLALEAFKVIAAENTLNNVLRGLEFAQRKFNVSLVDGRTALVDFKGAADDLAGLRGPGARAFETPFRRPPRETLPSLSPSQRRELGLIGREGSERIPLLQDRLQQLNNQLKDFHGNQEQRLRILTNIRNTEAEIAGISKDQAAARKAAADALKQQAEEAKRQLEALRSVARDEAAFVVERARSTASLTDDLKGLAAQRALLVRQLATQKGNLELRRDLFQVDQDTADVLRQQRDARQFKALGLGPTGGDLIPGVAALRRQLGNVSDAVKGTFLDTSKTRGLLANIRNILAGGMKGVSEDVRSTIREMLRDIDQQLKQHQGRLTRGRATDTRAVLAGLGLSPDQIRELRGRISQIGPTGRVPIRGQGAFGFGFPIVIQNQVELDGKVISLNTTKHQQQTANRTPAQRGGRSGGRAMGLA